MTKRMLDLAASSFGLVLTSPLLALIALAVKLDSRGPVLFGQRRIGRNFIAFKILKFRTMVQDAPRLGGAITTRDDVRITRVGSLLRRLKWDELPQLVNVARGEMSLVGPRPEVPRYVEMFHDDYATILRVRPGMTDLASLRFRNEAALLHAAKDPERVYVDRILPEKIRLAKFYVRRSTVGWDLCLIAQTLGAIVGIPTRRARVAE